MLTAFFDAKSIIHHEFVPENQTVNSKFHKRWLRDWSLEFITLGPNFRNVGPGIFCTTMHRRILRTLSLDFLAKRGIPMLSNPPYSPDLSLADFIS
jgi:hypothetical protein